MPINSIDGTFDPRFDRVRDAFAENFAQRGEMGATVAVTLEGRLVVDLWGGHADAARTRPWTRDTIVSVASATQVLTAICAHRLVESGALDLEAPVARYWPRFAQAGKAALPVHLLLSHRAGLPAIAAPLPTAALYDWTTMTRALAAQEPWWEPGTHHGYHALTFGWLVGEVVRRACGASPGALWRQQVAGPLGLDFHLGLAAVDDARVAELVAPRPGLQDVDRSLIESAGPMVQKAINNPPRSVADMNTLAWRRAEIGAANAHTNARALARLYGALACGGRFEGLDVLGAPAVERARREQASGPDAVLLGAATRFGLGFTLAPAGAGAAAFGCPGVGGAIGFADPEARIGFAYVMNQIRSGMAPDPRARRLIEATYASL